LKSADIIINVGTDLEAEKNFRGARMSIGTINGLGLAISQKKSAEAASSAPFENVLNKQTGKQSAIEMFSNLFPTYDVSCKMGNCDVSHADWERNDFPSWKFFEDNTKADELNNWKFSGNDVFSMDKDILNAWKRTGNRKMVIIIPDELMAKMQSDPIYAEQVLNKVYSWQSNHAALEKILSEGYGYDGELSTFQDSYLLKLDEDGNVTDYVVTGPGYDNSMKKDESDSSTKSFLLKVKKMIDIGKKFKSQEIFQDNITERISYDYTSSLGLLAAYSERKKRI
jgi:hypothetical protein